MGLPQRMSWAWRSEAAHDGSCGLAALIFGASQRRIGFHGQSDARPAGLFLIWWGYAVVSGNGVSVRCHLVSPGQGAEFWIGWIKRGERY